MKTTLWAGVIVLSALQLPAASHEPASDESANWSSKNAAAYLDGRAAWWMTWKSAARDHDTFCISCHTALPYALGRPALRSVLGEKSISTNERQLVENVKKRVRLWSEVEPFYNDAKNGAPKSAEARGTEAVLNALILTSYDSHEGKLGEDAKLALNNMWGIQLTSGDGAGAWTWLNFHNEPWEADDSQFWGASLGALAVGAAPKEYRALPEVQDHVRALSEYLQKHQDGQSLINRMFALWASTEVPGVMKPDQQKALINEVLAKQNEDGGWSTTSITISTWKRRDGTALHTRSDGYGTGLVSYILQRGGVSSSHPQMQQALGWLARNQDKNTGLWAATSMNKQRDPESDAGRFMSDAATAYSVLALTNRSSR